MKGSVLLFWLTLLHLFAPYALYGQRPVAKSSLYVRFRDYSQPVIVRNTIHIGQQPVAGLDSVTSLGTWRSVHRLPAAELTRMRHKAEAYWRRPLPDPNSEFYFVLNDPSTEARVLAMFRACGQIGHCSRVSPLFDATIPDMSPFQWYMKAMPSGINAEAVWVTSHTRGTGVKICDVETDFNGSHEDLGPVAIVGGTPQSPTGTNEHGTAVLGVIGALNNGCGSTGIASDAQLYFSSCFADYQYDMAGAISTAAFHLGPGDVMLLEQQLPGPNYVGWSQYGMVPVEWDIQCYNAIVLAVGQGITVVEAGGNGAEDLDAPAYCLGNNGHHPFLPANNSGAIIVGAGAVGSNLPGGHSVPRSKLWFSNYGSRIDMQASGECVVTLGYGDFYYWDGIDNYYTSNFNGTSSATSIIAGAAALLQSAYINTFGYPLTPELVRSLLASTGKPQQAGAYPVSQRIGPMPDVVLAIQEASGSLDIADHAGNASVALYPNPSQGPVYIHTSETVNGEISYSLCNVLGETMHEGLLLFVNGDAVLDLSAQPKGIYLLQSTNKRLRLSQKILLQE